MKNQKQMGFLTIYLLGINGIIGSGIFLLPGQTYKLVGNTSAIIIGLAALAISTIVLCYADLASRITGDGAAWLYTYQAFGEFPAFEVGVFTWVSGIITIAAEVAALMTILKELYPPLQGSSWEIILPMGLILLLGGLNLLGNDLTEKVDNISSAAKLLTMAVFIVVAAFFLKKSNLHQLAVTTSSTSEGIKNFGKAFNTTFYMFSGFAFLPVTANKMKNPQKNLPKALLAVLGTCVFLYTLIQIGTIGILGDKLAGSKVPVADAFKNLFGEGGYYLMMSGMLISVLGVAISTSFNTPYIASSLASEKNLFPKIMGKTNRYGVPSVAIIFSTLLALGLFLSGDYLFLVSCIVFVSFVQWIASLLATLKFRKSQPTTSGFHLPLGPTIPFMGLGVCLYLLTGFTFKIILFGIIIASSAAILYFWNKKKQR